MTESTMTMPGAFSCDTGCDFSRPVAIPSFYIPPSPSASSVLSSSISRTFSNPNLQCHKRPRLDPSRESLATPRLQRHGTFTSTYSFDAPSPATLVNTDYRIAGRPNTSTAEKLREEEQTPLEFEKDLRPNRYTLPTQPINDGYFPQTPSSTTLMSRKRQCSSSPRRTRSGLVHTVWTFTGDVAGKVFNFCWNTAFHGFHAGGGRGYHLCLGTPTVTSGLELEPKGEEDVFDAEYRRRGSTPIPGEFPDDNFIEDYMSRPQSHQVDETPTHFNDARDRSSLSGTWLMVNEPFDDREKSPARKRARPSTANMYARPMSRGSLPIAVRPRMPPRSSASGASYASARGTSLATHSPSQPQSSEGSTKHHKRSRSSIAQNRQSDLSASVSTPKSPEAIRFEKKLKKKDIKQDKSIARLNQQMQDMIREGQQALGARVEVVDDLDDGEDGTTEVPMANRW